MAEPIEQAFFGLMKFLFKLAIWWPLLGLFYLFRYLFYKHRAAKAQEELAAAYREVEEYHQGQLNQRSSTNTLYAGPK